MIWELFLGEPFQHTGNINVCSTGAIEQTVKTATIEAFLEVFIFLFFLLNIKNCMPIIADKFTV